MQRRYTDQLKLVGYQALSWLIAFRRGCYLFRMVDVGGQ